MPPKTGKGSLPTSPPAGGAPAVTALLNELPECAWVCDQRMQSVPAETLNAYTPKGLFRNDYLAYCKLLHIRPHPQLLPLEDVIEVPVDSSHSAIQLPDWRTHTHAHAHTCVHEDGGAESAGDLESKLDSDGKLELEVKPEPPARFFDFSIRSDLRIRNMRVGSADMYALLLAVKLSTHTRELHFHNAGLTAEQVLALGRALAHTQVRTLSLEFNPLPDAVVVLEAPPVAGAAGQQSATAGGSNASAKSSRPPSGAGSRDAAHVGGGAAGAEPRRVHVFAALLRRGAQQLSRLSLRGNGLRALDAAYMAEQLRFNNTVAELVLSHNAFGDDGAGMILDAVRDNRSLTMLSLASNKLTAASAKAVYDATRAYTLTGSQAKVRMHMESRVIGEILAEAAMVAAAGTPFITASNVPASAGAPAGGAPAPAAAVPAGDKKGKGGKEEADPAEPYRLPALRMISAGAPAPSAAGPSAALPAGSSTTPRAGTTAAATAKGGKKDASGAAPPGLPHVLPLPSEEPTAVYAGEGLLELAALFTPAPAQIESARSAAESVADSVSNSESASRTQSRAVSRASDGAMARRGSASSGGVAAAAKSDVSPLAAPTKPVPALPALQTSSTIDIAASSATLATAPKSARESHLTLVTAMIIPATPSWGKYFSPTDAYAEATAKVRQAFAAVPSIRLVDAIRGAVVDRTVSNRHNLPKRRGGRSRPPAIIHGMPGRFRTDVEAIILEWIMPQGP